MLTDLILEKISDSIKIPKNIWGRYDHVYNWSWNKEINKPTIYPLSFEYIKLTSAVFMRDWLISKKLAELGIKKVLDIGSDTGHLMATLNANNIDAVGIDSNIDACKYINNKAVNRCYNLSIQDLVQIKKLGNDYDCLTCLNITQAKWKDEKLKSDFIEYISNNFKYCVLSDITHQDRKWKHLKPLYDFKITRFPYNKLTQFIYRLLGNDVSVHYPSIQKLYKVK